MRRRARRRVGRGAVYQPGPDPRSAGGPATDAGAEASCLLEVAGRPPRLVARGSAPRRSRRSDGPTASPYSSPSCSSRAARSATGSHTDAAALAGGADLRAGRSAGPRAAPRSSRTPIEPSRSRRSTRRLLPGSRRHAGGSGHGRPAAARPRAARNPPAAAGWDRPASPDPSRTRRWSLRMPPSQRSGSAALRCEVLGTSGWGRIRNRSSARPVDDRVGHLLRLDDALRRAPPPPAALARRRRQHVGVHALRAQARDLDALVAVGDGQPLGERRRRRAW